MLLAARGAFLAARRKPKLPYDVEVEYLESVDATTFILLPLTWSSSAHVEVEWQRINRANQIIFGCRAKRAHANHVVLTHQRNNDNLSRFNLTNYTASVNGDWWSGADIQERRESLVVDYPALTVTYSLGTKSLAAFDQSFANDTTALFGSANSDGTGLYTGSAVRIFSFRASDATGDLYDLIPVRVGTEGAMYDRRGVGGMNPDGSPRTDGLYRNRGTGAFLYGPDKN